MGHGTLGRTGMMTPTASRDLAAAAWAEVAELLDRQLSPLGLAAMDALDPRPGETILDIGCGAGQTVRQLADRVGPSGRVLGIDIAPRILEVARARTASITQVTLIEADAATLALPDGMADGVYSRFGVMAMHDPIAAFSNFRRMMRAGGRLGFVCWRSLEENELDLLPLRAAALDLPIDPAPFRFERRDYLSEVLRSAGFRRIRIDAADTQVSSGGHGAMTSVLTKVGPLGRILRETPALLPVVEPRVRAALIARESGGEVRLRAAIWVVTATA